MKKLNYLYFCGQTFDLDQKTMNRMIEDVAALKVENEQLKLLLPANHKKLWHELKRLREAVRETCVAMTDKDFPHYWICYACATAKGGTWPEGHVATIAEMTCGYCEGKKQDTKFIAPWVDYDWPKVKTKHLRD